MKKKGFTLIEILVALAIFISSIMFLYKSNIKAMELRGKSVKNESLLSLTESLTYVMKNSEYTDYDQIDFVTDIDKKYTERLEIGIIDFENYFPSIKPIIDDIKIQGVDKKDMLIAVEKYSVIAEYAAGYGQPTELGRGNANRKLAFESSPNLARANMVNPFVTEPDDILRLEVTIWNKNQDKNKIKRTLYIFR